MTNEIEIERNIISLVLSEENNFNVAIGIGLKPNHFSSPRNIIFEKIIENDMQDKPINFSSLLLCLPDLQTEFCEIVDKGTKSTDLIYWAEELIAISFQKRLGLELSNLSKRIFNRKTFQDFSPLILELNNIIDKTNEERPVVNTQEPKDFFLKIIDNLTLRVEDFKNGKPRGFKTGIKKLDLHLQGFCPGRVYILAARTSIGKTTMAVNFLKSIVDQNKNALFFSIEMTEAEIGEKYLSLSSGVPSWKLFNGDISKIEADKIYDAINIDSKLGARINSRFGRSIEGLEQEAKRLFKLGKLDFLILDYLQQVKVNNKKYNSKAMELSEVSGRLKTLAMNYQIPILALAQINRDAMKTGDEPQMHHIKDSGSIEQDADVVMILHRQDFENKESEYWLNVAKNRHGQTGKFRIFGDLSINKFLGMD